MRTLLAVAVAIGLVCGGAVGARAEPARKALEISWGACTNAVLKDRDADCGFLSVPLDYANPSGTKIKLAVSRVRHRVPDAKYQGVMLVNPGGPGGSGLVLSVLGDYVPDRVGEAYDWIGFDPRGVGASKPALSCDDGYAGDGRPPYVPATRAIEKAWLARVAGYAKDCERRGGALLDHLRTVDSAADLESLRKALGVEQINYYGFSYGTYLGQVYASLHPQRVRRMVLDGVVDPRRVWYDANLDQDRAFDRNIKIYFGWLAKYHSTYHLGRTARAVEKRFYAEQAKLTGRRFGPAELTDVFLQAGYYVFGWPVVAEAYAAWVHDRDLGPLEALFEAGTDSDNGYAVYLGVQCTDTRWPQSWARWRRDNRAVHAAAPFETWGNAWYNAPCREWAGRPGRPVEVTGSSVAPVLLVSESLDAATPFSGSLEVRRRFPRSALIEGVGGTTHAASLFGGTCVDGAIAAYLKTGVVPHRAAGNRSDLRCPPQPQPDPTAGERRAAPISRTALQALIGHR